MDNIEQKVREIIGRVNKYGAELNSEENYIDYCGIDSIGLIVIVSNLEKEFNILIIDEDFNVGDINTIGKFTSYIQNKMDSGE